VAQLRANYSLNTVFLHIFWHESWHELNPASARRLRSSPRSCHSVWHEYRGNSSQGCLCALFDKVVSREVDPGQFAIAFEYLKPRQRAGRSKGCSTRNLSVMGKAFSIVGPSQRSRRYSSNVSCVRPQERSVPRMRSFLIAGLPRSGLCWLSRLFTVPHYSVCLSNGFGRVPGVDLFWSAGEGLCKDMGVEFFGNAATMNLVFYGFSSKIKTWRLAKALYLKRVPRVRIPPHPF